MYAVFLLFVLFVLQSTPNLLTFVYGFIAILTYSLIDFLVCVYVLHNFFMTPAAIVIGSSITRMRVASYLWGTHCPTLGALGVIILGLVTMSKLGYVRVEIQLFLC